MNQSKYYFYENLHDEYANTRCPKCKEKTKLRKFCLMVKTGQKLPVFPAVVAVRAECKFCSNCELIIKKKSEIESYLRQAGQGLEVNLDTTNHLVFGTMDISDWKKNLKTPPPLKEMIEKISVFKDIWKFDIQPAGWYFVDKK